MRLVLFLLAIANILSKPLTKEVLEYLNKDIITFNTYRKDLLKTTCNLIVYSKIKYMWENETIDKYLEKAKDKVGFVKAIKEKMFEKCSKEQSSINVIYFNNRMLLRKDFMFHGKRIMKNL
jgi:hypothetical protein